MTNEERYLARLRAYFGLTARPYHAEVRIGRHVYPLLIEPIPPYQNSGRGGFYARLAGRKPGQTPYVGRRWAIAMGERDRDCWNRRGFGRTRRDAVAAWALAKRHGWWWAGDLWHPLYGKPRDAWMRALYPDSSSEYDL